MANLPSNSLLARSRSTRSKTQQSTAPPASVVTAPTTSSNFSLLLTNIRLLDLDSLPDWPGFDVQSFAVQKRRIQWVEWVLYQLFVLWDSEEARNKLQPFYPPRDQVQSVNLRAALLRSLEQAKKNGVLGRDAVVRKTMLDECKGDRLEEVLAVFSSAVLKQIVAAVAEAEGEHPLPAQRLALENRGYIGERIELVTLALAHRVSLGKFLSQKNHARRQFRDLAELLDLKERSNARRHEQAKTNTAQGKDEQISDGMKLDIWRTVRNNWAGNERWMESLLYGDNNARRDGLLSTPFDRVWRRVQSDRLSELEDHGKGLLEQLDSRVRAQRERLERWQDFQTKMFGKGMNQTLQPAVQQRQRRRCIDLDFCTHEALHLGRMSPRKRASKGNPLTGEYLCLVNDFQNDLSRVGRPTTDVASILGSARRGPQPERPQSIPLAVDGLTDGTISELSELEDDILGVEAPKAQFTHGSIAQAATVHSEVDDRQLLETSCQPSRKALPLRPSTRPIEQAMAQSRELTHSAPAPPPRIPDLLTISDNQSPDASPTGGTGNVDPMIVIQPESPLRQPKSPTQELADQILASMNGASPSPAKQPKPRHTLSLIERTRLSMARMSRGKHFDPDEDDEEHIHTLPFRPSAATNIDPLEDTTGDLGHSIGGYEDLVARTRKSMAGYDAARQKAQLERRRSQRKSRAVRKDGSYFPKVDEEVANDDNSLIAEALMEGDQDYEAVFKSRPRIKTSPAPSPSRSRDVDG